MLRRANKCQKRILKKVTFPFLEEYSCVAVSRLNGGSPLIL